MTEGREVGALPGPEGWTFRVWAPRVPSVRLILPSQGDASGIPLDAEGNGYHGGVIPGLGEGTRYRFRLEGSDLPDPASRWQPEGVHGPSALVDLEGYPWTDGNWSGIDLSDLVIYELHVGTFSPEGTFAGVLARIPGLRKMGFTAVELMPVAQFPGRWNWGYDGVDLFAVESHYGGPHALQDLVDGAHRAGMAVLLDVVYNHLGPEGNYLGRFGPYFSERHGTPWGPGLNFDGPGSDEVRRFFTANARQWRDLMHLDGLRLDAIQGIVDTSADPFLRELSRELTPRSGRPFHLIAESDQNDPRTLQSPSKGGMGLHAQWADDFHHSFHAFLTGERRGYYQDFGGFHPMVRALKTPFVYEGQFSPYRGRRHGAPARGLAPHRFVVFLQNHDQVGNRAQGERWTHLVSPGDRRVAHALLVLGPYLPLFFMGEEYGEVRPFLFFTDHGDPALIAGVREGRRREFASWGAEETPDPQDPATFRRSQLDWETQDLPEREGTRRYLASLLALRHAHPSFRAPRGRRITFRERERWIRVDISASPAERWTLLAVWGGGWYPDRPGKVPTEPRHIWMDSEDPAYGGSGTPPEDGGRVRGPRFLLYGSTVPEGGSPWNGS